MNAFTTHSVCDACETVSHCMKNGCIPKVPAPADPLLARMLDSSQDRVSDAPQETQPEALRLAAWLNEGAWHQMRLGDVEAAGRELRRLHAENADLRAELQSAAALPAEPTQDWLDCPATRADALAEAAKDRADAERYRYLREKMIAADFNWNESGVCALVFEWPIDVPVGADCDRNIDAAIAAGGAR